MKVLMISTDRKVFDPSSEVRKRFIAYGELFDQLKIIVFTKKKHHFNNIILSDKVSVYSTNSLFSLGYIYQAWKKGVKIIKNDSDRNWIVSCQDPFETGLVGWLIVKSTKARLNLQLHTDVFSPFFSLESGKNRIRVILAKFLLPKADSIRVVSERIKKSLSFLDLKKEPIVLPIFINLTKKHDNFQKPIKLNGDFRIIMASRLTREKNFSLALATLNLIKEKLSNINLLIIGTGPEKQNIERKIKKNGLEKIVRVEDWSDDLSIYYQSADLFLLTSNYEGYGRTLIESAYWGCPILTTNVGLVGEIINQNNAFICPVGDEKCLADKVEEIFYNKKLAKEKSQLAKIKIDNILETGWGTYLEDYKKSLI